MSDSTQTGGTVAHTFKTGNGLWCAECNEAWVRHKPGPIESMPTGPLGLSQSGQVN